MPVAIAAYRSPISSAREIYPILKNWQPTFRALCMVSARCFQGNGSRWQPKPCNQSFTIFYDPGQNKMVLQLCVGGHHTDCLTSSPETYLVSKPWSAYKEWNLRLFLQRDRNGISSVCLTFPIIFHSLTQHKSREDFKVYILYPDTTIQMFSWLYLVIILDQAVSLHQFEGRLD